MYITMLPFLVWVIFVKIMFFWVPVELAKRFREPSGESSKWVADNLVVCLVMLHNNTHLSYIYHTHKKKVFESENGKWRVREEQEKVLQFFPRPSIPSHFTFLIVLNDVKRKFSSFFHSLKKTLTLHSLLKCLNRVCIIHLRHYSMTYFRIRFQCRDFFRVIWRFCNFYN